MSELVDTFTIIIASIISIIGMTNDNSEKGTRQLLFSIALILIVIATK